MKVNSMQEKDEALVKLMKHARRVANTVPYHSLTQASLFKL